MCILVGRCIEGGRSTSVSQSWGGAGGHPEGSGFRTRLRMPCLACIHLDSCTSGRHIEMIGLISSQNDSRSSGAAQQEMFSWILETASCEVFLSSLSFLFFSFMGVRAQHDPREEARRLETEAGGKGESEQ